MSNDSNIFNGRHVARPNINLGGSFSKSTQEEIVSFARRERLERESFRRQERAAGVIQAIWRGRKTASRIREQRRELFKNGHSEGVEGLRLLVSFLILDRGEDLKLAARWIRTSLADLFRWLDQEMSMLVLVRPFARWVLNQAGSKVEAVQTPLFVEFVKLLVDPQAGRKVGKGRIESRKSVAEYLLERGLYQLLGNIIKSVPVERKSHPALSSTIALALLPFKAFPPPLPVVKSSPAAPTPQRVSAISAFVLNILTIPFLPDRLPPNALAALSALPLESILEQMIQPAFLLGELAERRLEKEKGIHLLSNLVRLGRARVGTLTSGKALRAYLRVVQTLLDRVPVEAFAAQRAKKVPIIVLDEEGDEEMQLDQVGSTSRIDPVTTTVLDDHSTHLDPRTLGSILELASPEHLLAVLTLSTRYSASTRPALAAFLVSLLASFQAKREDILNTIMFSSSTSGTTERGGGLLRELWRGYIRAGKLSRTLGGSDRERSNLVMTSLVDSSLVEEWPVMILLIELYSRCLLTLGDDEFFAPTRNPLSLDEVVGMMDILRNLAFALYWQEGGVGWDETRVVGTRIGVEGLRSLATGLLQQVHARDSRKSFTPKDYWLMTSQFDLASFIQTVVFEDQNAVEEDTTEHGVSRARQGLEMDQNGNVAVRPGVVQSVKAKMSTRQMAFIGPRQGVLANIPFVIPFESRVAIFRQTILNDRKRLGIERHVYDRQRRHKAIIRRNHLSEDSFAHLNGLGAGLKSTVEIVFIDEHGLEEKGIDGGGLFKELLTSLSKEAFDTDRGLWLATKEQELYPNPHSYARESSQLGWYAFIGKILGKALYEGILIDVRFASFFLSKWLGRQSYLDDLSSLDPELYSGLLFLKNYVGNVETDLSLNFTVTDDDFGVQRTVELVPNGAEIPVTNSNRIEYIYLTSNYRLNKQVEKQSSAFFAGLSEIIPARSLKMFNQDELRMLVGGVDQPIDLEDLRLNTVYGGWEGDEANETIIDFWRVVESFDREERGQLVKFVTSCARPPLLGFVELSPRFAIRMAGNDETRLPTSSTCVNLLKLPQYKNPDNLRTKLLYAIKAGAGFDLS